MHVTDPLALVIAAWAGLLTLALMVGAALIIGAIGRLRKGSGGRTRDIPRRLAGVALISLVPLGFLSIAGFIAAALAEAAGTPPIAFPFVTIAGLAGLRAAKDAGSGEMGGCSRMIALFTACYVAVWGAVAWWLTGGFATLNGDLPRLRWLQPPLAALPFSVILWRLSGKKRTLWLLLGSLVFLSAWFALWFFTVEARPVARLLPASDWLRFPLAGLAAIVPLALFPLAGALQTRGAARSRRLRETARRLVPLALLLLPVGLAWAGARALLSML